MSCKIRSIHAFANKEFGAIEWNNERDKHESLTIQASRYPNFLGIKGGKSWKSDIQEIRSGVKKTPSSFLQRLMSIGSSLEAEAISLLKSRIWLIEKPDCRKTTVHEVDILEESEELSQTNCKTFKVMSTPDLILLGKESDEIIIVEVKCPALHHMNTKSIDMTLETLLNECTLDKNTISRAFWQAALYALVYEAKQFSIMAYYTLEDECCAKIFNFNMSTNLKLFILLTSAEYYRAIVSATVVTTKIKREKNACEMLMKNNLIDVCTIEPCFNHFIRE